jgi:hypothetical protein
MAKDYLLQLGHRERVTQLWEEWTKNSMYHVLTLRNGNLLIMVIEVQGCQQN